MIALDAHQSSMDQSLMYDSEDGIPRSPLLSPMIPNRKPVPSPPPEVPLPQVSPESSPRLHGRKGSNHSKRRQRHGDVVLVHYMEDGKSNIARNLEPLSSDDEDAEVTKSPPSNIMIQPQGHYLSAIAAGALRAANEGQTSRQRAGAAAGLNAPPAPEPMEEYISIVPSLTATLKNHSISSPEPSIILEATLGPGGELPPIRQQSPQSNLVNGSLAGPITLPSISDQLGDLNHLAENPPAAEPFSQSPPGRPPPLGFSTTMSPTQGSPPKSPNDTFRRELPSPGRSGPAGNYYYSPNTNPRRSSTETSPYTETPSTDQSASTPANALDPMSIDGITNPQIGGFKCRDPGCTALPFQTQYLLNSHANVHSSVRPHYCSVRGCPRSITGRGFKRKNEMIRHGLVHDSPGYVCPFCPEREHRYPRPDNLQRHVRAHHGDKDRNDPELREVLSQRIEGATRGKRRRAGGL